MNRCVSFIVMLLGVLLLLGGCGGSSGGTSKNPQSFTGGQGSDLTKPPIADDGNRSDDGGANLVDDADETDSAVYATVKFGRLADANVTIYKVEDNGSLTRL